MKKKLSQIKNTLSLKMEKLSEQDLSFLTGGSALESAAGSSGSHSGSGCDNTRVHCCYPDLPQIECHNKIQ
jgi:hypothetical protein